ncbi:hypothetical protein Ahy_A01g003598 [Arachis hypogaea]|uniref:Aminotransferase-like plant mobile domain-containing protein n=1 Tax=Arachis hypogaea TaxID=3818 RepID=A0A445ETD2_ARAHY|nr:hypothetical protein Ahy_A01g003598 [Arachis hypogaea]
MFGVVCNGCMLRDFVTHVLQSSRVITAVRRQQNMPLHDRIIPYLETAGFKVKQMTVCYTWFHKRFRVLPADATDKTVRVYARAYILMLLSSQLFEDKNANRVHLRWLPYLALLDDLGRYSWGSAALAWLYRCLCRGTNRNVVNLAGPLQLLQSWIFWRFPTLRPTGFDRFGFPLASRWAEFVPRNDAGAQRLVSARLALDRLRVHDVSDLFITDSCTSFSYMSLPHQTLIEPYSSADVAAVIHPEILADEHRRLWTAVTSLIYFAAIEWHQVDRVLPQFGGVQHLTDGALNIDRLHAKDGRGGDRWFPTYYQEWHQLWENRLQSVIWVDRVLDPGPSADYLEWWCRVAHRFLSLDDPRPIVLTEEARHRGSSQAPPRVHVYDRPDNRRVDRCRRIGTRTTDREWREFADRLEQDVPGAEAGDAVDYRVPRRRGRRPLARPNRRGAPEGEPSEQGDGTGHMPAEDVVGSASTMDQPTFDVGSSSQLFGNVSPYGFAEFTTAAVGMDIADPVTESEFYRDIADMLRDDDDTHYKPQMPEEHAHFAAQQPRSDDVQAQLAVDLNGPAVSPSDPWFALGGTPASAFSAVPAHPTAPAADHRPRRVRRPPLCGTGGHLLG